MKLQPIVWGKEEFKGKKLEQKDKEAIYSKIQMKAISDNVFSLHVSGPEYEYLVSISEDAGFFIYLMMSGNDVSRGNEDHWVIIGRTEAELNAYKQMI